MIEETTDEYSLPVEMEMEPEGTQVLKFIVDLYLIGSSLHAHSFPCFKEEVAILILWSALHVKLCKLVFLFISIGFMPKNSEHVLCLTRFLL
jgi:hypothetical protein